MRTLSAADSAEALDNEYESDALTLGGDEGAMVPLAAAGRLRIESVSQGQGRVTAHKLPLEVNGKLLDSANLGIGDRLAVPGYAMEIIAPPQGFDFALQLTAAGDAVPRYTTGIDIDKAAWSMRRASWIAVLLILLLCLVLPLLGIIDDALWSTGPLAPAHRTAGISGDCQACHRDPFVMVEDVACLNCHRSTTEHVNLSGHDGDAFSGERCAGCHREHNEPPHLVRRDKRLCVDCHSERLEWRPGGEVQAVSAFTRRGHPEFRLALLTPKGPGGAHGWELERVRRDSGKLRERSNLKFSHRDHLDSNKVRAPGTDSALVCDSCHLLKDDGEHFEAVTMDAHCRACHSLNFDIFEPELELPHGDLRAAVVAMEAHFIREFTDPVLRQQRAGEKPRRVPGKREAAAACQGTGLDCGRAEAVKEAQYQFANTGCISCHEVQDTGLANISDRWYVQPVRISGNWYPQNRFDHASHLNLAMASQGAVCETCHKASASQQAAEILIPGRDVCLNCHNEEKGDATVDCVSCHVFHREGGSLAALMRAKETLPNEDSQP